jgi:hypothetical protein
MRHLLQVDLTVAAWLILKEYGQRNTDGGHASPYRNRPYTHCYLVIGQE